MPLASSQAGSRSNIIETARKYLYVRESGYNRGAEIESWQKRLGGRPGYPYCAYFASAILDESGAKAPTIRTGRAQQFLTRNRINPMHVLKGYIKLKPGYLVVWAKYKNGKNTGTGHVGFVENQISADKIRTIEANTQSGERGNQQDGDGVYERNRNIIVRGSFRIIGFEVAQ